MEHQLAVKPKKAPTPGSWAKGVSGNPKGRPKRGDALAEAIRAKCDPEELATIALEIARSSASESVRIMALHFLAASGFVRPEQRHELVVAAGDQDEPDLGALTLEQLRRLRELDVERDAILALPDPSHQSAAETSTGTPTVTESVGHTRNVVNENSNRDDDRGRVPAVSAGAR